MKHEGSATGTRRVISTGFTWLQDGVYITLGVLLSVSAVAVLLPVALDLPRALTRGLETTSIVALLDRMLLALMIVELLYTVQISFREHTLVPEPFVLVALIAAIRRILVITAEFGAQSRPSEEVLRHVLLELALLTVLVAVLVAALVVLRARSAPAHAAGE